MAFERDTDGFPDISLFNWNEFMEADLHDFGPLKPSGTD